MSEPREQQETTTQPAVGRRRGVFGWLWRIALAVVLLLVAGGALLLGTEPGLRLIVGLAEKALAPQLTIGSVSGRLTGPLELRDLRFSEPALAFELDHARLDWQPTELFSGRVHVRELALGGMRLTPGESIPEEPKAAEPLTELPTIRLPIEVVVDRIAIEDARYVQEGIPPLESLLLRARAGGDALVIDEFDLRSPGLHVAIAGELGLTPTRPADLRINWSWDAPQGHALNGAGRIAGPPDALQITHEITGATEATVKASVAGLPAKPSWDAVIDLARIEPALLVADVPPLTVSGRVTSRGTPSNLVADASLRVDEPELGAHQIELAATLVDDLLRVSRLELSQPEGDAKLSATAQVRLADEPEFDVEAHWTALQWPPRGIAVATSPEGRLAVQGRPSAYRFEGSGKAVAPEAPPTTFTLAGTGDAAQARIERVLLELLDGSVDAAGTVGWNPEPRWDLKVTMGGIDPGVQWPEWKGRLKGVLTSLGRIGGDGPQASLEIAQVDGQLRDFPVSLTAAVQVAGEAVRIDRLALSSGTARVNAAGRIDEALDLSWSIDARDLNQLLPDAAGALKGEGKVGGTLQEPQLALKLTGGALRYGDNGIARLSADADLGLAPAAPLRLDVSATGISAAGKSVGDLIAKITGSQQDHRFTLDLTGGELGIGAALALSGALADDRSWTGRLERTELRTGEWGDWRLQRPVDLAIGETQEASPLCLASGESRVCVEGRRDAEGKWQAKADLSALPLALVQPYLPKDMTIVGAVTAKATASGDAAGALAADADVALPGARLTVPMGDEVRDLDLSRSTATARVNDRGATAEAKLFAGELASVDARAELPGWTPQADPAQQRLGGKLSARMPDLAFVKAFAPDLGAVSGQVALNLGLDGTLAKPRVTGQGGLTDGRIEVPDAGVEIRDIRLGVRSPGGERLEYEGGARSGAGELRITGQTVLDAAQGFPTALQLKGRDFTVFDTSEYLALVSPDLRLQTGKEGALLEGELLVPRATLRPAGLPEGAVAPSADVHIKGEEVKEQGSSPLAIRVRLRLGDQVRLEAYQLRVRLAGNLLIEQQPGRDLVGNGRLSVAEGIYSGLGRDLTIQRGELNFASSPLDNPGLNVRAVTETSEVTAGVSVTGTAREPKIELFSRPPRPQSEVLSYLLFGKPLSGTSDQDKSTVTDAAGALGSQLLAAQIGRQLGIDEFSVSGTGDKAALTVGQYVTPQLYLQYVSGLRSQINRLRMRYDITKWLQLQTETGDQQGADLFYIFER